VLSCTPHPSYGAANPGDSPARVSITVACIACTLLNLSCDHIVAVTSYIKTYTPDSKCMLIVLIHGTTTAKPEATSSTPAGRQPGVQAQATFLSSAPEACPWSKPKLFAHVHLLITHIHAQQHKLLSLQPDSHQYNWNALDTTSRVPADNSLIPATGTTGHIKCLSCRSHCELRPLTCHVLGT